MKRKEFLRLTAAGVSAIGLPLSLASCQPQAPKPELVIPRSLLGICDSATLRAIGTAYLEGNPSENQVEQLEHLISTDLTGSGDLSDEIGLKIVEEFRDGRWMEISGWILAPTEARQCALYSLLTL